MVQFENVWKPKKKKYQIKKKKIQKIEKQAKNK